MTPNHAHNDYTHDDHGGGDRSDPADDATFAHMLEQSSLGSDEARNARRAGSEIREELGARHAAWHIRPPAWVDVAELHTQMAEFFENQQRGEATELWLRAALLRSLNAPTATWLAVTLERRRNLGEAYVWYLRAAQQGDVVAAGRLAVTAQLAGDTDLAGLLLSIGSSTMTPSRRAAANKLAVHLSRAGARRRTVLLSESSDTDLMFWVGCMLFSFGGHNSLAGDCFSTAVSRGHRVAASTFYDVTEAASSSSANDGLAEVRSIADRLGRAIQGEPAGSAVPLRSGITDAERHEVPNEWISAAMTGDRVAVERLLGTIRPLIERYCRARLGGTERFSITADDVAQDTCLAVLAALPGYRVQTRPFLAFVYQIAAHKVIDARRAAGRDRSEVCAEPPDRTDTAPTPEARTLQVELTDEMARVLDILPEKHREIITLRIVVGLSAEETAEAVGSTPGAVRVAQHRALARLRKDMEARSINAMAPDHRA